MRICYLADGRYIHAHRWLRCFSSRGHQMSLLSFAPMDQRHIDAVEETGTKYLGEIGPFHLKRFWRTTSDWLFLRRVLRSENIQILHCHYLGAHAWYAALSGFSPLVVTVMGGGDVRGPGWRPSGTRERLLTPFTLRRCALITSWSKIMAEAVRPYCRAGTDIEVIHGGIDLQRFHPGGKPRYLLDKLQLPPTAKIVFSPRLMRPLSNIHQIAEAAAKVLREESHTYFIFAAPDEERDDDYYKRVHQLLQESNAIDNSRFVGSIPHDQMPDYHRLADVTVSIPSTDGTPMTVLEAMASERATIVGDIPDYDRWYFDPEKTVLTAKVGDAASVAHAITRLFRDRALSERLQTEARRRVESTGSYDAQMSRMEELYLKLL